ncbi:MAG: hypothetical protein DCC68_15520 [Planctomycetota bacterium]|nr:MAG: hypothetical protein DCC68_15520 [Planctomycetota bacterium]
MEAEATRYKQRAEAAERELAGLKAKAAGRAPDGSRSIDNGTDSVAVRAAAQWVLQVGGAVELLDADKLVYSVSSGKPLPERPFQIVGLNLDVPKSSSSTALANFAGIREHLGAFRGVLWIRFRINWYIRNATFLEELPRLESVSIFGSSKATDIEALSALPKLTRLTVSHFPSDGYGHLPRLIVLRFLSIQEGTVVADELTQVLEKMAGLKAVELPDSGASRLVAARMKDLRPELSVRLVQTNRGGDNAGK